MGIYDRDYVRTGGGGGGMAGGRAPRFSAWSFNTWLIVVNMAVFVVQKLAPQLGAWIFDWGHFSTQRGFAMMEVWRLVTFQFLHAGLWHVGFNMLGLYFFGSLVEQYLGKKRYAAYYLMCGLSGGVLYLILNLVGWMGLPLPGALHVDPATPLVGASAGVFGVIVACAYISPNTVVHLLIPPIPLKMRTFAYGYVALVAANLFFFRGANQGGDAAHLGGALAGYYFIRRPHLLRDFFDVFGNSNKPKVRPGPRTGKKRSSADKEIDAILA
ncbi:MAG: rhomboid family intramembrane serine protease, partial [Phycisphaerales bacterium]|nr:rhomboid family intramembrane serine protease [Phycisphaerales bacterium]